MKISKPDRKKIYFLGLLLLIVTLLTYFDTNVFVDNLETTNGVFGVKGITLKSEMGKPKSENKGMNTPPTPSQQAPTKKAGPKPQTSESGKNSTSISAASNMIPNVHQTFNANQSYGVQNIPGTVSDSQYTSLSQFNAPYDKYNGNVTTTTATTFTTMNQATINSATNSGYASNVPPPPPLIMNSGSPMSSMGVIDGMNPMNNAHYISTLNSANPANSNNPMASMNNTSPMTFYAQGSHANTMFDNTAPPWAAQLFQGLDARLHQIESQIVKQNTRWQHIEETLQNQNSIIQNQNSRISSMESQIPEIDNLKTNVTRVESNVQMLNSDVKKSNKQMQDYKTSIESFSEICDGITKENQSSECKYMDLLERVGSLEFEHSKLENTVVDLQCRSMRDNLIFTGIPEVDLEDENDYENVERTLVNFLADEMYIRMPIGFHRVHRLGYLDKTTEEQRPRPIIAKFEKFKDREFVRSKAPQTLRNKNFGVREQFPKVIEDQRKLLYPEAKKARQNDKNKVRLVRDKLFVNNSEVVVEQKMPPSGFDKNETRHTRKTNSYRRETTRADYNSGYRWNRVFYRGGKQNGFVRRSSENARTVDFSMPTSNKFSTLADYVATPVPGRNDPGSKKHPASSPLDEQTRKKQRDESNSDSDASEMNVSFTNDNSEQTPVPQGSSSGNTDTSDEQKLPNTPDSVTSTVTVMPNLQWSATSPNTTSSNNPDKHQGERDQTAA